MWMEDYSVYGTARSHRIPIQRTYPTLRKLRLSSNSLSKILSCASWSRKYASLILIYAVSYLTIGRTRMSVWVLEIKNWGSSSPSPSLEHHRVIR